METSEFSEQLEHRQGLQSWWEKMGILARSLPGNLTIWRETLTFEIKKYIRNSGKSDGHFGKVIAGKFNHLEGNFDF